MFSKKPNPRAAELDAEISRVLETMSHINADDEEYTTASNNLATLNAEREKILSNRFSKDQMLLVGGNILVAILVVGHERAHVISTKLPQFLHKAKS